ncbi:hypothetical protein [Emcibacter sp.]|uniref:hypothetical protein n=1 Tax=Emcibacter sp. TaxID=1979954 RepID=UPI002AA91210|nr:hypothetical protein [Emcibacter sp.]
MSSSVTKAKYIRREIIASAIINSLFSAGFFLGIFGGHDQVTVWGVGNYAFDFLPQSFAIGLMASLVPGLLTHKAVGAGKISDFSGTRPTVSLIVQHAIRYAVIASLLGSGLCALMLWISGLELIAYHAAFMLKILYGVLLGALVTRLVLGRMIA